jgi:hypothetical protein
MYFTLGIDEARAVVRKAAGHDGAHDASLADLKRDFRSWLALRQCEASLGPTGSEPDIVDDPTVEAELLRGFITDVDMGDVTPINDSTIAEAVGRRDVATVRRKGARMRGAFHDLEALSPELGSFIALMIKRIFVVEMKGEAGGSSPLNIGVIWANPPDKADAWDLAEYLLHEFTHNTIYLDERLRPHYQRQDILVRSAIRKQPRPLRAVVHSLAVSLEILQLRRIAGRDASGILHPCSEPLLESCQATIESILAHDDWQSFFRPRGRYFFDSLRRVWEDLARTSPEAGLTIFDTC